MNTASQTYCAINLPRAQIPTSVKQLISSYSADQNQVMLYNIHLPPENVSLAGQSVFPSWNQGQTSDTQQKTKKSTQYVDLKHEARKCWKCEKEGCGGRIRMD